MLCPSVDILGIPSAQGISDSPAAWRSLHASSPSASERCSYRRCSDWSPISWQKKGERTTRVWSSQMIFLLTKLGYSWYSNTSQYQLSQEICLPESLCYKAPKPWQFLSGQQSILSMQGGPTQNDLLGQSWLCYWAEQSPESMHDGFHEVKHRWI